MTDELIFRTINELRAQLAHMLTRAERDAQAYRAQERVIAALVRACEIAQCEATCLGPRLQGVFAGGMKAVAEYCTSALALARKPDADVLKVTP